VPISEAVTAEPSRFVSASSDGAKAIFSIDPDGFEAEEEEEDLYEFDVGHNGKVANLRPRLKPRCGGKKRR
jgi:hypothetical protein